MLKSFFLVCCFLILLHHGHAQLYPFTVFNTSNGLVNNRCGNISQDSAGYIWIGTDNGICNYDGRKFIFFPGHFTTYYFGQSQPNMYKGNCLLGTGNEGLAKCAGTTLSFIRPSPKNRGHIMSLLAINDSTYLIARLNRHHLLLMQGKKEREIPFPEAIDTKDCQLLLLLEDAEKNIWAGTSNGVFVFLKGDLEKPFVVPVLKGKYTNGMKEDFEHNIFISSEGGIYKMARPQLKKIEQESPFLFYQTEEHITSIGFLRNGDILLGQMTQGIKIFSSNLQWIKDITVINGLNNTVWDIFTDRENNTWFATDNGLLRLRAVDFIYFPAPSKAFSNITSGAFYKTNFLFCNSGDLLMVKDEKKYLLYDNAGYTKDMMEYIFVTPDNEIWVNTFSKIAYNNVTHRTYSYSFKNNKATKEKDIQKTYGLSNPVDLRQTINISTTDMFFLTEEGKPYLYSGQKVKKIIPNNDRIPSTFSIVAKGNEANEIWLMNAAKGLYHCRLVQQNNTASLLLLQAITASPEILSSCRAIFFTKDEHLWLGTSNKGILIYRNEAGKGYVYKKQITAPAISSVLITTMLQDSAGNMWIGTNNGIDKISFASDNSYSITKGMFDNTLTGRLIYFLQEKNKTLYIGTTGSLAIAKINTPQIKGPPLVNINHLIVNNTKADSLLIEKNREFESDENNFGFEFVGLSFINEKQTEYQYKLEGADTAWSNPSPNYSVTYAKLKPGTYTFRVRAKNADDTWSEKDATFSFIIKKPFYQHWAFILLCSGICCGFAYWLYRQKIAGILAVERTRQHISKDLHDDIGSTLSSITLMNAVLKNKIEKKPDEAAKLAEKIEDTSRQMIQNMSDIVWSINPGNDTMDKLQNRLQQFCADVFEDTDTTHKLIFSDTLLKKSLPMQLRRDVYLICKEITNNAAKYSRAKNYTLALSLDKGHICIEAVDDGIGFDNTLANSGNGLNNIKLRVEANKGHLALDTTKGTAWKIKIPVD